LIYCNKVLPDLPESELAHRFGVRQEAGFVDQSSFRFLHKQQFVAQLGRAELPTRKQLHLKSIN